LESVKLPTADKSTLGVFSGLTPPEKATFLEPTELAFLRREIRGRVAGGGLPRKSRHA
jgi:hypothetical protein